MWNLLEFKDNTAVITEDGETFSYARLSEETEALAAVVPARCLVFNLCSNTAGSLIGYVSFLNHGIVPLMLDEHIDRELLGNFLTLYKPDYLWLPSEKTAEFEGEPVYASNGYTLLKRADEHAYPLYEELALLLTTSGSTGSPKFVRQSYKNIQANTRSIVEYLEIGETEGAFSGLAIAITGVFTVLAAPIAAALPV